MHTGATGLPHAKWCRLRRWSKSHPSAQDIPPAADRPRQRYCIPHTVLCTSEQPRHASTRSVLHAARSHWQKFCRGSAKYRSSYRKLLLHLNFLRIPQRSSVLWLAATTCSATLSSSTAGSALFCTNIRYSILPSGPFTGLKSSPRTAKPFAAA